jgi:hypothetical protein
MKIGKIGESSVCPAFPAFPRPAFPLQGASSGIRGVFLILHHNLSCSAVRGLLRGTNGDSQRRRSARRSRRKGRGRMRSGRDKVIFVTLDWPLLKKAIETVSRKSLRTLLLMALSLGFAKYERINNTNFRTLVAWCMTIVLWGAAVTLFSEYRDPSKKHRGSVGMGATASGQKEFRPIVFRNFYISLSWIIPGILFLFFWLPPSWPYRVALIAWMVLVLLAFSGLEFYRLRRGSDGRSN